MYDHIQYNPVGNPYTLLLIIYMYQSSMWLEIWSSSKSTSRYYLNSGIIIIPINRLLLLIKRGYVCGDRKLMSVTSLEVLHLLDDWNGTYRALVQPVKYQLGPTPTPRVEKGLFWHVTVSNLLCLNIHLAVMLLYLWLEAGWTLLIAPSPSPLFVNSYDVPWLWLCYCTSCLHCLHCLHYGSAFTGWETSNRYIVRNTLGQQVYFAAESKLTYIAVSVCGMYLQASARVFLIIVCNGNYGFCWQWL